jgi:hypothetical protein
MYTDLTFETIKRKPLLCKKDAYQLAYKNSIKNNSSIPYIEEQTIKNKNGYIYLIRPREHLVLDKKIYKIGQTVQQINSRLTTYDPNSKILMIIKVEHPQKVETNLLSLFKVFFKPVQGNEYFKGNAMRMMRIIMNYYCNNHTSFNGCHCHLNLTQPTINNYQIINEQPIITNISIIDDRFESVPSNDNNLIVVDVADIEPVPSAASAAYIEPVPSAANATCIGSNSNSSITNQFDDNNDINSDIDNKPNVDLLELGDIDREELDRQAAEQAHIDGMYKYIDELKQENAKKREYIDKVNAVAEHIVASFNIEPKPKINPLDYIDVVPEYRIKPTLYYPDIDYDYVRYFKAYKTNRNVKIGKEQKNGLIMEFCICLYNRSDKEFFTELINDGYIEYRTSCQHNSRCLNGAFVISQKDMFLYIPFTIWIRIKYQIDLSHDKELKRLASIIFNKTFYITKIYDIPCYII